MSTGFLISYRAASEIVSRLCSFGVVLLAARMLSTPDFGLFSLAWASGWMVAIGSDFGLQLELTREVARKPEQAERLFRQIGRWRATLCAGLLLISLALLSSLLDPRQVAPFFLIILSQVLASLIDFHNYLFRGLGRSDLESSLNLAWKFGNLLFAGVALAAFGTFPALALVMGVSSGLGLFAARRISRALFKQRGALGGIDVQPVVIAARPQSITARDGCPTLESHGRNRIGIPQEQPELSGLSSKNLVRRTWPIGVGILASVLAFRADLFFLEYWQGSATVGLYNAVFRLVDALRLLPAAVMAVVFPELCRPGARRPFLLSTAGLFGASLLISAIGIWQSRWIVELAYGRSFLPAAPVLELLLISLPFLFVNFVLTHQLLGLNQERAYALLCTAGLFLSLLLNELLVPALGMRGAAWVCLGREVGLTGACALILYLRPSRPSLSGRVESSQVAGS